MKTRFLAERRIPYLHSHFVRVVDPTLYSRISLVDRQKLGITEEETLEYAKQVQQLIRIWNHI